MKQMKTEGLSGFVSLRASPVPDVLVSVFKPSVQALKTQGIGAWPGFVTWCQVHGAGS
jgi:hypothetical protein